MTLSPIKKVQNVSLIKKKKKVLGENKVTASGNLLTEKDFKAQMPSERQNMSGS